METQEILNFLREAEEKKVLFAKSTKEIKNFKSRLDDLYNSLQDEKQKENLGILIDDFMEIVNVIRKDFYELGEISASVKNLK